MTKTETKRLKVGSRVEIWSGTEHACKGTVIETGPTGLRFKWDDGETTVIHRSDMTNVKEVGA